MKFGLSFDGICRITEVTNVTCDQANPGIEISGQNVIGQQCKQFRK